MEATTTFVPVLSIGSGVKDIDFYKNAFGAIELWRLNNPDGSVHVAAFSVNGAVFRLHEESKDGRNKSPDTAGGTTLTIGMTAEDVHAELARALAAGATLVSPVTDYGYGYRQGEIRDPFGHCWLIEKLVDEKALYDFVNNG